MVLIDMNISLVFAVKGVIKMNDIVTIITTVGFPIFSFLVAGLALKYVYDRERKSLDDTINKLSDLTSAVNHNSEVIARLAEKEDK